MSRATRALDRTCGPRRNGALNIQGPCDPRHLTLLELLYMLRLMTSGSMLPTYCSPWPTQVEACGMVAEASSPYDATRANALAKAQHLQARSTLIEEVHIQAHEPRL